MLLTIPEHAARLAGERHSKRAQTHSERNVLSESSRSEEFCDEVDRPALLVDPRIVEAHYISVLHVLEHADLMSELLAFFDIVVRSHLRCNDFVKLSSAEAGQNVEQAEPEHSKSVPAAHLIPSHLDALALVKSFVHCLKRAFAQDRVILHPAQRERATEYTNLFNVSIRLHKHTTNRSKRLAP